MAISPRFMHELRDRLTLSEIIGRRIKIARAGREFKACCPFHHEKTPSFTINDDKQFYHCFGCGAHGDAIAFIMQHDNRSFIDAVEMLAAEAGLEVPEQTPQEIETAKKAKDVRSLLEDTAKYFEEVLHSPKNEDALRYLGERGLSDEILSAFRIGYAPSDGQALRMHLKGKDYTDEQMIEAGVIRHSDKGKEPYAFFRERIMFPVSDRRGRVVAFGGRILPDHLRPPEKGDFKPPKYINSSDTPLFHKGKMLYNESHARQAAINDQPVIIVEGYLDVIACFEAGWQGAVAPLGTALTEEQTLILWKMIPSQQKVPVLCFDGDTAGRRAAVRAAGHVLPLLKPDQSVHFAFLPDGQDPDSLIKSQGKQAFQAVIDGAMPLVDFLWLIHTDGKRFYTPESRAGLAKSLDDEVARIADMKVQRYYRQAFQEKLWNAFRKRSWKNLNKQQGKGGYSNTKETAPGIQLRRPAFSRTQMPQLTLLASIINHPALFETVEEELGLLSLSNERLDSLRRSVLNLLDGDSALDAETLKNHLYEAGYKAELKAVLSDAIYTHAGFAKPGVELDIVRKGWQKTIDFMQQKQLYKDLCAAKKILVDDFTEENEQKVMALLDVNKAVDG